MTFQSLPPCSRIGELALVPLESRIVPSFASIGAEFRVNSYTTGNQNSPDVAVDQDGDFVVTWQSNLQDGSGYGIYAQRYNSAGAAQGSAIQVNTYTSDNQNLPAVAMDLAGNFAVVWQSDLQDGSGYGIYARRYNSAGTAQGGAFRVNTSTNDFQTSPAIAMNAIGNFVVTWQSNAQDGGGLGIYAQRYNSAGVAQGGEFRVNNTTTGNQVNPSVAIDQSGNFIVAWDSPQDGSGNGVYARRFNSAGAAQGTESRLNTHTTGQQVLPSVAMDQDGDFAVVWMSYLQDASGWGVYAQRYNSAGTAQAGEFRVNSFTNNGQDVPSIAMDSDGNFVVAWSSYLQDGSLNGVYAQAYKVGGVADGSELRVNTRTTNHQSLPRVVLGAAGDAVVAWDSTNQDGSGVGVYAQRYKLSSAPPPTATIKVDSGTGQRSMIQSITVAFSEPVNLTANAFTVARLVTSTNAVPNGAVNVSVNPPSPSSSFTITFNDSTYAPAVGTAKSLIDGKYTVTLNANQITSVASGQQLDGDGNGTAGDSRIHNFSRLFGDVNGDGFTDNTDFLAFRAASGSNSGQGNYNVALDVNGDGFIDNIDFIGFRQRLGLTP